VADVQLLVQVGGEAFEDDRLTWRLRQGRQLVVGRGEVVVVEAGLLFVVIAGRQISEGTPWNRNRLPARAAVA
jgi:hypothetical protein